LNSTQVDRSGLGRFVPILNGLPKYKQSWLRINLVAGLTASAVVIPQAMEVFQVMELDSKPGNTSANTSIMRE